MKRKIRKLITGAISATALISSVSFNAGAENVQPRGLWHVYGDVNNDGTIDLIDIININKAVNKYRELTGEEQLPMRIAVAVPQAADVNGDGYISLEDSDMVLRYVAEQREDIGRCGEHFYIS